MDGCSMEMMVAVKISSLRGGVTPIYSCAPLEEVCGLCTVWLTIYAPSLSTSMQYAPPSQGYTNQTIHFDNVNKAILNWSIKSTDSWMSRKHGNVFHLQRQGDCLRLHTLQNPGRRPSVGGKLIRMNAQKDVDKESLELDRLSKAWGDEQRKPTRQHNPPQNKPSAVPTATDNGTQFQCQPTCVITSSPFWPN